jgi:FtsZ-binding cell division protein ZapB
MNRKIVVGAVLFAIIAASIATWFVHTQISELQSQNSDLQNQINELQEQNRDLQEENGELKQQLDLLQKRVNFEPEVLITNFSSPYGWQYMGGMTGFIQFNIAISNTGISDVEGLTLEIKRLNVDEDPLNITRKLAILHAGETTEIGADFVYSYELGFRLSYVATLKLGEMVLDVQYLSP